MIHYVIGLLGESCMSHYDCSSFFANSYCQAIMRNNICKCLPEYRPNQFYDACEKGKTLIYIYEYWHIINIYI